MYSCIEHNLKEKNKFLVLGGVVTLIHAISFLNLGLKDIEENLSDVVPYCFSQVQPFFLPEVEQSCPSQPSTVDCISDY